MSIRLPIGAEDSRRYPARCGLSFATYWLQKAAFLRSPAHRVANGGP